MALKHKYNIPSMLLSVIGYKGLPYPGIFSPKRPDGDCITDEPRIDTAPAKLQELVKGTRLRKLDERGIWHFMPVYVKHPDIQGSSDSGDGSQENTLELPNAVIGITGKKTIVTTPMIGRKGSVKELINIDDYEITIAGFIQSKDGTYPEAEITQMRDLFNINEAVELVSALTDLILDEGDRVVITDIDFPSTPGIEDGQVVRIECVTDKEFELIIE